MGPEHEDVITIKGGNMQFIATEAVTTVIEPTVGTVAGAEKNKEEVAVNANTKKSNSGKD